jgi:ectoine hydroxylase-related dioxygenase (phytanoyl-CoA dioxygenase family)
MNEPIGQTGKMTELEKFMFDAAGYLVVPDALTPAQTAACIAAAERCYASQPKDQWNQLGTAYETEPALEELIDLPAMLPKVRALLGDYFHLQSSWLTQVPPRSPALGYHQDGYNPYPFRNLAPTTPLLQLRIGYVLTDMSQPGIGNLVFVPGSHKTFAPLPGKLNAGDVPSEHLLTAKPGTAILFHQGVWHASGPNRQDYARVMMHMVYSPPWLIKRQRNSQAFLDRLPPLRRALLDNWLDSANSYNNMKPLPFGD